MLTQLCTRGQLFKSGGRWHCRNCGDYGDQCLSCPPSALFPLTYKSNSAATISRRVLEKSRWSLVTLTPLVLACRSAGSTDNPGERRRLSLTRQQGTNLERRLRIQYRQPLPFRAKRSDHGFHRPYTFQERASRRHGRPGVAISIPPGQWAL